MPVCNTCLLDHGSDAAWDGDRQACIDAQSAAMKKLLELVGDPGICRGCQRPIYWMRHKNGARVPYTSAGLNHFIDCPEREQFRKKRAVSR